MNWEVHTMPKGANQKLKLYYLSRILTEKTDDEHSLTLSEIQHYLEEYGVTANRKSLYDDFNALEVLGIEVIGERSSRDYVYHVGKKQFELAELKLLVDSIQSSKFITEKKSNDLINKLTGLASDYEAKQLRRQVFVHGRIKTMNESIYYNVDVIHTAIAQNSKITFQYFQWDVHKKMVLRHSGAIYEASPWALSWDDENYYLIAYDSVAGKIKHFRVDKMKNIRIKEEKREGKSSFKEFDMAAYAKKTFGMFGGEEQSVKMLCDNSLAGVIIDRFGKEVMMVPVDDEHFEVNVKVAVSRQFFGWVIALGEGVKITEPERVVEQMREEIYRLNKQYL
jgi:predicted DNA-binding transcriptional regulator YafY